MGKKTKQQELWDVQLDILNVIDQTCRKNRLNYSLYTGILLGAVRNKGLFHGVMIRTSAYPEITMKDF